jgi:hypothetical protein
MTENKIEKSDGRQPDIGDTKSCNGVQPRYCGHFKKEIGLTPSARSINALSGRLQHRLGLIPTAKGLQMFRPSLQPLTALGFIVV